MSNFLASATPSSPIFRKRKLGPPASKFVTPKTALMQSIKMESVCNSTVGKISR